MGACIRVGACRSHLDLVEVVRAQVFAEHQVGDDIMPSKFIRHGEGDRVLVVVGSE